jgi:hypothetical protein
MIFEEIHSANERRKKKEIRTRMSTTDVISPSVGMSVIEYRRTAWFVVWKEATGHYVLIILVKIIISGVLSVFFCGIRTISCPLRYDVIHGCPFGYIPQTLNSPTT